MPESKMLIGRLFPGLNKTIEEFELLYPLRNLPDTSKVTRYAPSPTGFIHIGALYAALISERLAHQSGGVFFLRIEDTDKKRELTDGVSEIVKSISDFGINIDEGAIDLKSEKGKYGPYKQSDRKEIYQTYAAHLIGLGLAYPCFCTEEENNKIRAKQEENKLNTGYYGEWAVHRNFTPEQI